MKRRLLVLAALAAGLAGTGLALAQTNTDNTTTQSTGSNANAADFLRGEAVQDFYIDPKMKTMKSADEVKRVYEAMTADDQAKMKAACVANQESKFVDLCKNIGKL
jgi:hypothetical protein